MQTKHENPTTTKSTDLVDAKALFANLELAEDTELNLAFDTAFDNKASDEADEGYFSDLENIDTPLEYFPENANDYKEQVEQMQSAASDSEKNIKISTGGSGIFVTLALLAISPQPIRRRA